MWFPERNAWLTEKCSNIVGAGMMMILTKLKCWVVFLPHHFGHISFKCRISWSDVISASRRLVAFPQGGAARSEECDPLYRSHRARSLLPCQLREGFTVASIRLLRHCPVAVKGLYISPQSSKFHSGVSFDLQGSIQYQEATHISSGTLCIYYFLI